MILCVTALLLDRSRARHLGGRVSLRMLLVRWLPVACACVMRLRLLPLGRGAMPDNLDRRRLQPVEGSLHRNGWRARHLTSPAIRWVSLTMRGRRSSNQVLSALYVPAVLGLISLLALVGVPLIIGPFGPLVRRTSRTGRSILRASPSLLSLRVPAVSAVGCSNSSRRSAMRAPPAVDRMPAVAILTALPAEAAT